MKHIVPLFVVGVIGGFALMGCESIVHEPTHLSQNKIQVSEEKVFENLAVADLDDGAIAGLAKHYTRYGDGQMDISVTYDPKSSAHTAMWASGEAARITEAFRANGVSYVVANIIPVNGQDADARALISYRSYSAHPPEDCEVMPGLTHHNIDVDEDYKIGCSVNTLISKQIARPKDLRGRSDDALSSDGRRAGNVLDAYRAGIPNEALDGETASE